MRLWTILLILSSTALLLASEETAFAEPADEQVEKERSAKALELCRKGAKEYRLCLEDAQRTELELKSDPVLRWSNPAVGSIHSGIFIWTHEGRPAAVASVFKWFHPRMEMAFEVHSLSTTRLVGMLGTKEVWKSSRPGVEYKSIPGAAVPAGSAAARLVQMRTMSSDFVVEKTDRDDDSKQRMRLLTQPVYRYSSKSVQVTDGAMFAFVQGTDPEVLLLLEAQELQSGPVWKFALARMNSTAFNVTYKDEQAWAVEVVPWGVVFNNSEPYNILNLDHLSPPK
jgi:hypothetical protein